jgi:hypothetical protein
MLRNELTDAFGHSDDVFQGMNVKAIFKGVTYESLSDPEFMRIAGQAISSESSRSRDGSHDGIDDRDVSRGVPRSSGGTFGIT